MRVVTGTVLALSAWDSTDAAEIEVKMLNAGKKAVMVFEPNLVRILPGDSVHFVAADRGHNVASIKGMMPEGATPFVGRMSQDVTVKFEVPGIYGVKCDPHYPMGMVGLVVVGTPTNFDRARTFRHPGRARQVFAEIFDEYDQVRKAER
jgi:pseudoazurin